MKKIAISFLLAALICLGAILLASCGNDVPAIAIGENGNWFIDGVDSGIAADHGRVIVDVETTTEPHPVTGLPSIKTVLTYSDGTTSVEYKEQEHSVDYIQLETHGPFFVGYEPLLRLYVSENDYNSHRYIPITDDMWASEKPDFSTPGIYSVILCYRGAQYATDIEVKEAPEDLQITDAYLDSSVMVGTPFSEVGMWVQFSGDFTISYRVPLSTASYVSVSDFNTSGQRYVAYTVGEKSGHTLMTIYGMGSYNLNYSSLDNAVLHHNSISVGNREAFAAIQKELVEKARIYVELLEYVGNHCAYRYVDITSDMLDISGVDITKAGTYEIDVKVDDPVAGKFVHKIPITVVADTTGIFPLNSYRTENHMFAGEYASDLQLYENGMAMHGGMFCNYVREGNTVVISNFSFAHGQKTYLTVDDENGTFDAMPLSDGTPVASYINNDNHIRFDVYENYVQAYYVPDSETVQLVATLSNEIAEDGSFYWGIYKVNLFSNGTWNYW